MMRARRMVRLSLVLLLFPAVAWAQLDAPPEPPLEPAPIPQPGPPPAPQPTPAPPAWLPPPPDATAQFPSAPAPKYLSRVRTHRPSPAWTQDRIFTSTRFWLLDPGNYEAQVWFRTRVFSDSANAPTEFLLQGEIEIGVVPHLQIDLYENLTFNQQPDGSRGVQQEGNQIEARIAIPSYYGQMPLNPVFYLEWHPRHNQPDRFEFRLLIGGSPVPWLYLAANPYVETNVESSDLTTGMLNGLGQPVTYSKLVADMEFGTTLAAGFRVSPWLVLSAESKIGADMLGSVDNQLHFIWYLGPGFILKPLPAPWRRYFKIMGTCLIAIPPTPVESQAVEPLLIIGSAW
jgi:hypothetical protein